MPEHHADCIGVPASAGIRPQGRKLSEILHRIAEEQCRDRISVGDLLGVMQDRALGALLFIFAAPNILPTPPGTSSVLSVPIILLAAQLMFGMRAWLPNVIAARSMARRDFAAVVARLSPRLARAERLLRPRLEVLARSPVERAVGAICLALALVLLLPIPLGNMLPALAICLFALGILERDGLWIIAGTVTSVAAVALVWGVVYALIETALVIIAHAFD